MNKYHTREPMLSTWDHFDQDSQNLYKKLKPLLSIACVLGIALGLML